MIKIAILASGSGSNAENIATYFKTKNTAEVALIISNKPNAYVLERAKKLDIESMVINRQSFYHSENLIDELKARNIEWLVLAGFLWLVPKYLIQAFPNHIINIHPALLPKYGGKGMYGMNVHKAVVAAQEKETGITIHYVNEVYDEGKVIFQATCEVQQEDTPDDVAQKIHQLEYRHFPVIIENLLLDQSK